jgi:TFIIF-interacting CTD phosphatase-like protein
MIPLKIINFNHMKKLIILDLDNTLIYASFLKLPAKILFKYSDYLTIYERPHAKEFVQKCQTKGDIVIYTTAVRDYAKKVCEHLKIKPIELFSREDCLIINGQYVKSVPDYYFDLYDDISIFDDSPELWDKKSHEKCRVIGVTPFTGEADDDELN